jgi:hypothetical protein
MRRSERGGTKGAKGEAVHPLPFLALGRTVPGPGEEYGAEDYVLLPDVFGDMGGKKSKPLPKPYLPLPKEVAAQKGEKPDTGPSAVELRAPDSEAGGQGISRKRDKEKRWADQMEEDEAELAREKASLAEERERWRANRQEEGILNLGAPTGKTVMELLAEKEAQSQREEQPKKGRSPLDAGFIKTAKKGGPDAAMEMALQVKDPLIQANLTRTLRVTRGEETRSSDSDSPTEDEEEDTRAVQKGRVWANQQQGFEKGREARGRRRADPLESGKESEKKVKRSGDDKEVEEMGTDKAPQFRGDLEMTEVKGPPERESGHKKGGARPTGRERERLVAADAERGRLQEEKEGERLKQEQTQEEGCRLMPESI